MNWQAIWDWTKKAARWVAASLPLVLLIVGALVLVLLGVKNIQIGGLISKLLGKTADEERKTVEVANTIPESRVDQNGNLIPIGTPDSQGTTQAKVVAIETPGLFDDPKQVKIIPPGETTPIVVNLPDGVKSGDVDKVVIVSPEITLVTVKDKSNVSSSDVDDLLKKYAP